MKTLESTYEPLNFSSLSLVTIKSSDHITGFFNFTRSIANANMAVAQF